MWDIFISHAWEDKEAIARPLAEMLTQAGLRVWYDEFTLTLGDSLRRSIDQGLAQSRYGIVILSPNFFSKEWPKRELDGLAAREVDSGKVILPVWHGIDHNQIVHYSPVLADKMAVSTSRGLAAVLKEILRVTGSQASTVQDSEIKSLGQTNNFELGDVTIVTSVPGAPCHLLIDPSIEQQWKELDHEIVLRALGKSTDYPKSGDLAKLVAPDVTIFTPDSFFTEHLIYESDSSDAFPGCVPVLSNGDRKQRNVVLPLSPEVLKLFTAQTLADNFAVDWQLDGTAVCRLRMLLHSSLGSRLCVVQKTFQKASFVQIKNLPLICIWPDFRLQMGWHLYFIFQEWYGDHDELSVRPWSVADRTPSSTRKLHNSQHRFQICQTGSYPEALICETPYNRDGQSERYASGILLLKLPDLLAPTEHPPVRLGIQFGPTSSSVFQGIPGQKPEPVLFKNRVCQVTDHDPGQFQAICRNLFIPASERSGKNILSVFHDFGDLPGGENTRQVIRDGHILYLDHPRRYLVDPSSVKSNLMWGNDSERCVARDFLTQLCLEAAAEMAVRGVNGVDLCFSYPTEISCAELNRLTAGWNHIANLISGFTSMRLRMSPDKIGNSEIVAATRFFSIAGDAPIAGTTIVILISSITTCLAVWNNFELREYNSILLADRDILLEPVRNNPAVLEEIDPQIYLDIQGRKDAADVSYVDILISSLSQNLIAALPARQNRPNVRGVLRLLEIGFCGIGFYAGLMIRRLIENKSIEKTDINSISIFVGGKGARIVNCCTLGISLEESEIKDSFSRSFRTGMNLPSLPIHFQLSDQPNAEVASGLVSDPLILRILDDFSPPMAGEVFGTRENNTRKRSWADSPTLEEIRACSVTVDCSFPIFQQFLRCMDLAIEPQDLDRICGFVNTKLAESSYICSQNRPPQRDDLLSSEPIFAMALKRLLQIEIEKWIFRARGL